MLSLFQTLSGKPGPDIREQTSPVMHRKTLIYWFMRSRSAIFSLLSLFFLLPLSAQVKIRIFTDAVPEVAIFAVTKGEYEIDPFNGSPVRAGIGSLILITRYGDRLVVKGLNERGFICDSVFIAGKTGDDRFSLKMNTNVSVRQTYAGNLKCLPDMGSMLFINICDIETYIAGVVRSEGGPGKHIEYIKNQAVIARTYMYRYMGRHMADGFDLCDNTHCQAFHGITDDTVVVEASLATRGQVIVGSDTSLIIAAFHSNCGGETAPSEDVWLDSQPYLQKVRDPHCLTSRNATWSRSFTITDWKGYLTKSGYSGVAITPSMLNFSQLTRADEYRVGSFSLPLRQMRTDLGLRSTFFSVSSEGDSVILKGRGYGHGVGLCQEGAMMMALKGFNYRQIAEFYYTGTRIIDIEDASR
jgi:stage II sporulation protein D